MASVVFFCASWRESPAGMVLRKYEGAPGARGKAACRVEGTGSWHQLEAGERDVDTWARDGRVLRAEGFELYLGCQLGKTCWCVRWRGYRKEGSSMTARLIV